ncbi:hypothetical protein ACFPOI_32840 [Nonomuraea angiospora]|uniref:Uncharacterized protein n=1 Tax=Nonomuraea angiospora TaxID=46172 RepID=A0ABR9LTC0_9ACTN|nr:hypothetical protein [Nonomuraea angiospora]MBE1583620.1 hypothetical protein [Nonomuraea angiospora]
MDADASLDPRRLPGVAAPVLGGDADLVLGAAGREARAPGPGTPGSGTPPSPTPCAAAPG